MLLKVLVLGGDGYLGWATAMHLSAHGHDVSVVDNYCRRDICRELELDYLFDVPNLHRRAEIWKGISGKTINVQIGNLAEKEFMYRTIRGVDPEAVVHYAEQPSAPYSMLDDDSALFTLNNNIGVTANLIMAIKKFNQDCHIVKLGTMGEYGTPNIDIEEGWLTVNHKNREQKFLYPRQASSLYHTTKILDTDLLWFYVRVANLRVTDLMQGPVYGIHTEESVHTPDLNPIFNYDELFGTVLNRFLVQAVCGIPLTVYGKGGQTRGYLNLKDTIQCVKLAIENPASAGELRIMNQFTETFSVNQLAEMVSEAGRKCGLNVKIMQVENPRKELEEHYYNPAHSALMDLGLKPTLLTEVALVEMIETIKSSASRIRENIIVKGVKW